jgi:uncharacterized membrane protein
MPKRSRTKRSKVSKNYASIWNSPLASILISFLIIIASPLIIDVFLRDYEIRSLVELDSDLFISPIGLFIAFYIIFKATGFKIYSTPRGNSRIKDPHGKFTHRIWVFPIILGVIGIYLSINYLGINQFMSAILSDLYANLSEEYLISVSLWSYSLSVSYLVLVTYFHVFLILLIIWVYNPKVLGISSPWQSKR